MRRGRPCVLVIGVGLAGGFLASAARAETRSFLITNFDMLLGNGTARDCSGGPALSAGEMYLSKLKVSAEERARLAVDAPLGLSYKGSTGRKGEDLCKIPTAAPDPGVSTVHGKVVAEGMDLAQKDMCR